MIFLNKEREAVAPLAGKPAAKHFDVGIEPGAIARFPVMNKPLRPRRIIKIEN